QLFPLVSSELRFTSKPALHWQSWPWLASETDGRSGPLPADRPPASELLPALLDWGCPPPALSRAPPPTPNSNAAPAWPLRSALSASVDCAACLSDRVSACRPNCSAPPSARNSSAPG